MTTQQISPLNPDYAWLIAVPKRAEFNEPLFHFDERVKFRSDAENGVRYWETGRIRGMKFIEAEGDWIYVALYQRFTQALSNWKSEVLPLTFKEQQQLASGYIPNVQKHSCAVNGMTKSVFQRPPRPTSQKNAIYTKAKVGGSLASALGQLALQVMDKGEFGFSIQEAFALNLINKSLFQLANKIGFLNIVSRNAETNEPLYAFFHRTFQEYFAALAIDDWHFFLNHIPDNPSLGTYRIFEPQWKEVIWLWLGREDVEKEQKEKLLNALIELGDGCNNFYGYRAFFLAAAALTEFTDYSRADEIAAQLRYWSFGYLNDENHKEQMLLDPIKEKAIATLPKSEDSQAITTLIEILHTNKDEDICLKAARSLGQIDPGNETAIANLTNLLRTSQDKKILQQAAESLRQIAPGNKDASAALVRLNQSTSFNSQNESIRSLGVNGLKTNETKSQMTRVVTALKDYLSDEAQENDFERYRDAYELIWKYAQNLPYPDFYQAWHQQKRVENTTTLSRNQLNLVADFPKLLRAAINSDMELNYQVQLICIDGSKFIERDNPTPKIYNEMRRQGCPKSEDSKPKTMAQLQDYWDELNLESDKHLVLVFYESTSLVREEIKEKERFAKSFLRDLSKFDGNICVVTEQPDIPLKSFSPSQSNLPEELVAWIRRVVWESESSNLPEANNLQRL